MSPINPVNGPVQPIRSPQAPQAGNQAGNAEGKSFGDTLKDALNQVNKTQETSEASVRNMLTGKSDDVLSTVAATAKADMSFKLLIGVRNKVIEAYRQTMNMQI